MTAKDQKIIDANPNADVFTLTELGLSNKGLQEFIENSGKKEPSNKLKAAKVEQVPDFMAHPQLSSQPHFANNTRLSDDVQVLNIKRANATPRTMTRTAAQKLVRQYPSEFKLIE